MTLSMASPGRPVVAGDATRAKLIEGASAAFYRYGVAKTTIDDVAREVRVSRRTVYRYFTNKDELFLAVINHELEGISRECRLIYETSPFGEGLVEVALLMTRRVAESPTLSRMFAIDAAGETFEVLFGGHEFTASVERFLASFIRRAQRRGELRDDISVADATEWITHLIFSLLAPNPVISEHDDEHVRFLLRTFVLPGLTISSKSQAAAPAASGTKTGSAKTGNAKNGGAKDGVAKDGVAKDGVAKTRSPRAARGKTPKTVLAQDAMPEGVTAEAAS
jgi:AcrR family transcriptional regulator